MTSTTLHVTGTAVKYWIFTREDGTCLAIHEETLGDYGICDEMGELAFDHPMPEITAQQLVARQGGQLIGADTRLNDPMYDSAPEARSLAG